jgi:hypothetical protein
MLNHKQTAVVLAIGLAAVLMTSACSRVQALTQASGVHEAQAQLSQIGDRLANLEKQPQVFLGGPTRDNSQLSKDEYGHGELDINDLEPSLFQHGR